MASRLALFWTLGAALAAGGCIPADDGEPADAEAPDVEPPVIITDAETDEGVEDAEVLPDGGGEGDMADLDGGSEGDGGADPDAALPDAAPPPDAAVLTIDSCQAACDRYAECDRIGERFGDYDSCINDCERISRLGPPEEWWGCVELETCNLLRLCPVPPIEPLPCGEVCDLVGECEIDFPRGECVTACEEFGEPYRTCGDHLYGGVCDGETFRRCAIDVSFPQCGRTCARGVACNLVREGECLDSCFDPDPLAQRARRRINACAAGAADDCERLDACFADAPNADPAGRCAALCEAKTLCGVDLGVDNIACINACINNVVEPGGPDYAAESVCANEPSCPEFATCLDAAGAAIGPCFAWCQATTTCNPEADEDRTRCVTRCVEGFGDDDTLRFGAAAACLADIGPGGSCEDLVPCIPEGEPMVDCEGVCASLERCRVPGDDCLAACQAAPDRDLAICLADAQRTGLGCGGVAACAGYEPPAPPAQCEALCDIVTPCDGEVDPYLCRLDCTPLPPAVPHQLACAEFAGCGDLDVCLALDGTPSPTCEELCTPVAAVTCGLYESVAACQAACTGLDANPRSPADFLERADQCLSAAINGEVCDQAAAASCFAPATCDLRDDLVFYAGGAQGQVRTDTRNLPDAYPSSCGGGGGPEQIVVVNISAPSTLTVEMIEADHDTVLNVRSPCDAAQGTCNDDGGEGLLSRISLAADPGTYYVFVEGFAGRTGTGTLQVTIAPR